VKTGVITAENSALPSQEYTYILKWIWKVGYK